VACSIATAVGRGFKLLDWAVKVCSCKCMHSPGGPCPSNTQLPGGQSWLSQDSASSGFGRQAGRTPDASAARHRGGLSNGC